MTKSQDIIRVYHPLQFLCGCWGKKPEYFELQCTWILLLLKQCEYILCISIYNNIIDSQKNLNILCVCTIRIFASLNTWMTLSHTLFNQTRPQLILESFVDVGCHKDIAICITETVFKCLQMSLPVQNLFFHLSFFGSKSWTNDLLGCEQHSRGPKATTEINDTSHRPATCWN